MDSQQLKNAKLPDTPGVYFFAGKRGEILYIGRATSLKSRTRSYFSADVAAKRSPAIAQMTKEAVRVRFEKTESVLEALILEAKLIKKHQPKYNVREKDDKSFNYVVITKEDFPRVLLIRGRELNTLNFLKANAYKPQAVFGPFPRGNILREALKILRRIFPFRDKCKPCAPSDGRATSVRGRPCFERQIGLCSGVCTGEIGGADYRKIISNLKMFFEGKKKTLLKKLEREMEVAAKNQEFEKASQIKRTVFSLKHISDVSLLKDNVFKRLLLEIGRIEGYDVAHLSGIAMVGVMTVLKDGESDKGEYRKFNIKTVRGADDTASLEEILRRRFGHHEWLYPRLIVVDGGIAQKNRAERVLKEMGIEIPVASVVKDEKHRPRGILGDKKIAKMYEREILLVNSEAHRFAISYHRRLRGKLPR